jgi:hypothetical protein
MSLSATVASHWNVDSEPSSSVGCVINLETLLRWIIGAVQASHSPVGQLMQASKVPLLCNGC